MSTRSRKLTGQEDEGAGGGSGRCVASRDLFDGGRS